MDNLRNCYAKKACLNYSYSEMLIDMFRFCIRNDISLSKLIGKSVSKMLPTPQDTRHQMVDGSSTADTLIKECGVKSAVVASPQYSGTQPAILACSTFSVT